MDLEDLGGVDSDDQLPPAETVTPTSDRDSPFRASVRKDTREEKRKNKDKHSKTASQDAGKESSPFRASTERNTSPFKAEVKTEEESPFKAKSKGSVLKSSKSDSPSKANNKENQSPFKAGKRENQSPFKAGKTENQSVFNASDKRESQSPFAAKSKGTESPFLAKSGSSPFRASNEGSIFKSTESKSPFKVSSRSPSPDKDRSSPLFKAKSSSGKGTKKKQDKKSGKKKSKAKNDKSSDIFSALGIQTVEDLLVPVVKETESVITVMEVDDDVRSEISEEIKTEKPSVYSYSQRFDNSFTEIVSEVVDGTKYSAMPSYTEEFESISEKIGQSFDKGRSSASDIPTRYSGEESVLDESEFDDSDDSRTRTGSRSDTELKTRGYNDRSASEDESTYTEDYEDYSKR